MQGNYPNNDYHMHINLLLIFKIKLCQYINHMNYYWNKLNIVYLYMVNSHHHQDNHPNNVVQGINIVKIKFFMKILFQYMNHIRYYQSMLNILHLYMANNLVVQDNYPNNVLLDINISSKHFFMMILYPHKSRTQFHYCKLNSKSNKANNHLNQDNYHNIFKYNYNLLLPLNNFMI